MTLHPAVIALIAGLPATAVGYFVYLQSKKVHKTAEQSGITTGMSQLITNLQDDNDDMREIIKDLKSDIVGFVKEIAALREEIKILSQLLTKNGKQ